MQIVKGKYKTNWSEILKGRADNKNCQAEITNPTKKNMSHSPPQKKQKYIVKPLASECSDTLKL